MNPLFGTKEQAGRGWAYRLRERYLSGESLLPIQIHYASGALDEVWSGGVCSQKLPAPTE